MVRTSSTACSSVVLVLFDGVFLLDEAVAEGFVTLADLELKERVDCAARMRELEAVVPLLRRPEGMSFACIQNSSVRDLW